MTPRPDAVREADVVVVGAGAAGLSVALGLAGRRVDLLAKGPLGRTGESPLAQGGVAGAVGPGDSPALHAADTLAVAGELADPGAVARLTAGGSGAARGPRRPRGALRPGRGGPARPRPRGGALACPRAPRPGRHGGRGGARPGARRSPGGAASPSSSARSPSTWCWTAGAWRASSPGTPTGRSCSIAPARSSSPPAASAASSRAPRTRPRRPATASRSPGAPARASPTSSSCSSTRPPSTWAPTRCPSSPRRCAGAGADPRGRGRPADPGRRRAAAELLPRDVVARALWSALASGRRALLDAREAVGDAFPERFPTVFEACRQHGLDPRLEPIPVAPAAHYHMGGVDVDLDGPDERARPLGGGRGGLHRRPRRQPPGQQLAPRGARLRRARGAERRRGAAAPAPAGPRAGAAVRSARPPATTRPPRRPWPAIRRVMWERVGLVRTGEGLREALAGDRGAGGVDPAGGRGGAQPRHGGPPRRDGRARAPREPRRALPGRPPPCRNRPGAGVSS